MYKMLKKYTKSTAANLSDQIVIDLFFHKWPHLLHSRVYIITFCLASIPDNLWFGFFRPDQNKRFTIYDVYIKTSSCTHALKWNKHTAKKLNYVHHIAFISKKLMMSYRCFKLKYISINNWEYQPCN